MAESLPMRALDAQQGRARRLEGSLVLPQGRGRLALQALVQGDRPACVLDGEPLPLPEDREEHGQGGAQREEEAGQGLVPLQAHLGGPHFDGPLVISPWTRTIWSWVSRICSWVCTMDAWSSTRRSFSALSSRWFASLRGNASAMEAMAQAASAASRLRCILRRRAFSSCASSPCMGRSSGLGPAAG